MLKNLSIAWKLRSGFGVIISLTIVMSVASAIFTSRIKSETNDIANTALPALVAANRLDYNALKIRAITIQAAASFRADQLKEIDGLLVSVVKDLKELREARAQQGDQAGVAALWKLEEHINHLVDLGKKMADTWVTQGGIDAAGPELDEFTKSGDRIQQELVLLREQYMGGLTVGVTRTGDALALVQLIMITLSIVGVIVALLIASLTSSSIVTRVGDAVSITMKLSQGDFVTDINVDSKDEIGQLLLSMKRMAGTLRTMIADIKSTADSVASNSGQLSVNAKQMSEGVTEQSAMAVHIAASTEEMAKTVTDIAKNAALMSVAAEDSTKVARNGGEIVDKSVGEVTAIADTVNSSATMVRSLGERSKQIGAIVHVIKNIADQTNLLALNAAIEAARAGEHGRGFAVVADEVRILAARTTKATAEISDMIHAIQKEVDDTVASINEGTRRVALGVGYSKEAKVALDGIVSSINDLSGSIYQIASATEEMSTVSENIGSDIDSIAKVSKETSKGAVQIAQSATHLARLSSDMRGIIAQFNV